MVVYFIIKIVQHPGSGVEMVCFQRGRGNKVRKSENLTVRAFSYYNLLVNVAQANKGYIMAQVGLLEDNARIARLCATLLQYAGHQVTVYDTPQQCLHALLSHGRTLESV